MNPIASVAQTSKACEDAAIALALFLENNLDAGGKSELLGHLERCKACKQKFEEVRQVNVLLGDAFEGIELSRNFDENAGRKLSSMRATPGLPVAAPRSSVTITSSFDEIDPERREAIEITQRAGAFMLLAGKAPWWFVSCALHALVLALAGLVSMAIELPHGDDSVIMVTELQPRTEVQSEPDKKPATVEDVLRPENAATDPNSKEASEVVVPPDILAKAELSDHFETINPDREDRHSAYGNEDARLFHSVEGNASAVGGGGTGGVGMDDVIGAGGAASRGSGGGFGGGDGTGIGTGSGPGKGAFGTRFGGRKLLIKRHGGSAATESAVDRALQWLAYHQEPDGHWDHKKWGCTEEYHIGICGDAAMTGYAVLAFLGAGNTERVGKYKENVQRGLAWLLEKQGKGLDRWNKFPHEGRWSDLNYTQGIAAMALCEAAAMGHNPEVRKAAQKAVNAIDDAQIQHEGNSDREAWDYWPVGTHMTANTQDDSSVMAWNVLALKSAKIAGLKVNTFCFEGTLNWINAAQMIKDFDPKNPSYEYVGGMMPYRGTVANPGPSHGSFATMAAAALCRIMIGGADLDAPGVAGPCNYIKGNPQAEPKTWPFNLYYGYYGALLNFQKGGDYWKQWNDAMKPMLVGAQCKGGDNDGSWDFPADTKCESRVMSTCLACLMLEVYYRYEKLHPDGAEVPAAK